MKIQKPLRRILTYSSGVCLLSLSSVKASYDNDWWSMGPVGGKFQVQSGQAYVAVREVEAGGPAELAGVQAGDFIMGAFGKQFDSTPGGNDGYMGAPQGLADAIERAESSDGQMPLILLRPGVGTVNVTVNLPVAGAFGPAYPLGSTKYDAIYQRASSQIHTEISNDADGDVGYMTGFYGLVLLADPNWNDTTGAKPYRVSIDKMRDRAVTVLNAAIVNPVEATTSMVPLTMVLKMTVTRMIRAMLVWVSRTGGFLPGPCFWLSTARRLEIPPWMLPSSVQQTC